MNQTDNWQSTLRQTLLQDPKKTGIMSALLLVLAIVGGRALFSGSGHPSLAAGSLAVSPGAMTSLNPQSPARSNNALRTWLSEPAPTLTRNSFLIRMDDFPVDPTHPGQTTGDISDGAFWNDIEKSQSVQADQQDQRQNAIAAIRTQAESIRPSSTMMGNHPRAMVNGILLGEGETIDGFCLLRIEPRGIIVERDGVKLAVPLR